MRRDLKRHKGDQPKPKPIDAPDKVWNKLVRAHTERSELSQTEIAQRSGIPERRLRRILNGHTHVRMGDAWAIALALGDKIETLFRDPDQRRAA